jgi:flagellar hook assembly protein FlgD
LSKNIVSDKAEFEVVLPNDKVLEVKAIIYDNTGNVVFEKTQNGAKFSWDLTNAAGRNVANGSYLIVAEARGAKGTYAYSAKVGVKR